MASYIGEERGGGICVLTPPFSKMRLFFFKSAPSGNRFGGGGKEGLLTTL